MSGGKYPSIFSCQMATIVYIFLCKWRLFFTLPMMVKLMKTLVLSNDPVFNI